MKRPVFRLYRPLADRWWFFDNALSSGPELIARAELGQPEQVLNAAVWAAYLQQYR